MKRYFLFVIASTGGRILKVNKDLREDLGGIIDFLDRMFAEKNSMEVVAVNKFDGTGFNIRECFQYVLFIPSGYDEKEI